MTTTETTTEVQSVQVIVYGPNLGQQYGPTFHVHTPECDDLKRRRIYRDAETPWKADVSSWTDLVTTIYDPSDFQYDPEDSDQFSPFESDVKVFPCVTLPGDPPPTRAARRQTNAVQDGMLECRTCKHTLPVVKFPTKPALDDGTVPRDDQCRACRDFRKESKKIGRPLSVVRPGSPPVTTPSLSPVVATDPAPGTDTAPVPTMAHTAA